MELCFDFAIIDEQKPLFSVIIYVGYTTITDATDIYNSSTLLQ